MCDCEELRKHYENPNFDLAGHWAGWKLRGNVLVSPWGDRITPQRLAGFALRQDLEKRAGRGRRDSAEVVALRGATAALARHADR